MIDHGAGGPEPMTQEEAEAFFSDEAMAGARSESEATVPTGRDGDRGNPEPARRRITVPDVDKALDAALRYRDAADESWDNLILHASDLAASPTAVPDAGDRKCARQLKLRLQGAPRRAQTDGEIFMFYHGHRLHALLSELVQQGFEILDNGWRIVGIEQRVDADVDGELICTLDAELHGPNGEIAVLDYKTKRGRAFNYLQSAKPANVIQVQTYMKGKNADFGLIMYVDREGSNVSRTFLVHRDDEMVETAYAEVVAIRDSDEMPPVLEQSLNVVENKGPDSVYLNMPWQCEWCPFLDVSCPGAAHESMRTSRVVGHIKEVKETKEHKAGKIFVPAKDQTEIIVRVAEQLLQTQGRLSVEPAENAA